MLSPYSPRSPPPRKHLSQEFIARLFLLWTKPNHLFFYPRYLGTSKSLSPICVTSRQYVAGPRSWRVEFARRPKVQSYYLNVHSWEKLDMYFHTRSHTPGKRCVLSLTLFCDAFYKEQIFRLGDHKVVNMRNFVNGTHETRGCEERSVGMAIRRR